MMQRKKLLALFMSVVMAAGVFANVSTAAGNQSTGERLTYDGVKYKTSRQAASNEVFRDTRKGLLLQTYGSGSTAKFKETFSGDFEIEMKALAEKTRPNVSEYRLHFTSVTTGETFAVGVKDTGNETSVYVVVDEELAGISYAIDYDDKSHGFTTSENSAGVYTKVKGAHTADILFDPATMEIKVKNSGVGEAYKTVWCLTKSVVDGRRFPHVLKPFDYYSVTIEFTQVKTGTSGELLIYNVNGEDYGESSLAPVAAMINSNLELQAVVGQKYTLPEAGVYGEEGVQDISCVVNDENGKELAFGKVKDGLSFTPKKAGTYYLYYSVAGQEDAGTYVTLRAYKASEIQCKIQSTDALTESVGVNTTLHIPARLAESNGIVEGRKVYTDISIARDGKIQEEKDAEEKGFDYTFQEAGMYTVTWSVDICGKKVKDEMAVNVDAGIPGIVGAEYKTAYEKDAQLPLEEATVYLNGETCQTTACLVKPSGNKVEEQNVTLDEIGKYKVIYTYEAGGEKKQFERSFQVEYASENVFTAGEDTKVYYDDTAGNADMPGVQIEMSSKNAVATYAKTVDLSDNTKLDKLIELYVIPNSTGTRDLTGFYITLTDKLNPENYISIRVIAGDGNMSSGSYIRIKASGQDGYLGLYKDHSWDQEPYTWTDMIEQSMAHDKGGYTTDLDFAFANSVIDIQNKTLVLRYDAKEKAIYSQQRFKLVHDKNYREDLVADLDDPTLYKNLWQGFTDDSQVELSISPVSVSGTATFKILSVDGENLGKKVLADTTAPEVTIDYQGMKEAPVGKVGLSYPIFDVIATDDLCADETLVKQVTVKHQGKDVEVKENAFIPMKEGTYQIQYRVSDGFGNTTRKNVNVEVKQSVPKINIKMESPLPKTMTYGLPYYVPEFQGVGGSGKHTLRTYYIFNGEEKEFENSFIPMEEGEYTVVCEARDYIGQIAKATQTIQVVFKPEILFEDQNIVLPEAVAADYVYGFEKYVATYYEKVGDELKQVACAIEVTDGNGTTKVGDDYLYTPKMSKNKKATVKFIFRAEVDGKTISKEVIKEVKLVAVSKDNQFMTDYFIKKNAKMKALNRYTVFSAAASGDAKASFIRAVQVRDFSLVMKADEPKEGAFNSDFNKLRVTLTDKNHKDETVQFVITKKGKGLMMSVNGTKPVAIPGSLTAESASNIEIGYKNDTYAVNAAENTDVCKIATYLDGRTFEGFTSGEAYVTMELLGAKAGSAIDLISLNNQTFLGAMVDTIDPQMFVNGSYSGIFTEGTKLKIPTADAYDVLNYVSVPVVSVTDEEGKSIKALDGTQMEAASADKEYEIQLKKLGRYTVSYTAEDATGRKVVVSKTIEIMDDVLPTLELKGSYSESVSAGKTVDVKDYKLKDNGDTDKIEVRVYCSRPNGSISEIKDGEISTKEKGIYTVSYFLTDENGNRNVESFAFVAK